MAWAIPSTRPTMLPFAFSAWVRKIGNTGVSISVDMSANRLLAVTRKVFFERPGAARSVIDPPRCFTEGHRAIDEVSNVSRRVTSLSVPISLRLDRLKRELHPSIDVLSLCRVLDCDPTFSPPAAPPYVMTKDKGQARVRAPRGDNVYGRLRDFQV